MILKSPKGIYIQLESGKIISIKASGKTDSSKENSIADDKLISHSVQSSNSLKSESFMESSNMRQTNFPIANQNKSNKNVAPISAEPEKLNAQASRMNTSSHNRNTNTNYGNSTYHSEQKMEAKQFGHYQNVPFNKYSDQIHNAHALYPHAQSSAADMDTLKHEVDSNGKHVTNTHMHTMTDNRNSLHGMYSHNAYNSNVDPFRSNAKTDPNRNYDSKPIGALKEASSDPMSKYSSQYNPPQYTNQMHMNRRHTNVPTTMPSHMNTNEKSTFIPTSSREHMDYNNKASFTGKEDNSKLLTAPASNQHRPYNQTGECLFNETISKFIYAYIGICTRSTQI